MAKILSYGDAGSGKSYTSFSPLLHPDFKLIYYMMEGNSAPALKAWLQDHPLKKYPVLADLRERLFIKTVRFDKAAAQVGIKSLKKYAKMTTSDTLKNRADSLAKKNTGEFFKTFYENIWEGCEDDNGNKIPPMKELDASYVMNLDNFSRIQSAIELFVIGDAPGQGLDERGIVQTWIKKFLGDLTSLECHVNLLGHKKLAKMPGSMSEEAMPYVNGQALNGQVPSMFQEVLYFHKAKGKYLMATDKKNVVCRTSALSLSDSHVPDLLPILQSELGNPLDDFFNQ